MIKYENITKVSNIKKMLAVTLILVPLPFLGVKFWLMPARSEILSVATEAEFEEINMETEFTTNKFLNRLHQRYPDIDNWQRPEGPLKAGLQVGHWKNSELPDELERLRGVSTGTSGGGKTEVEVNLMIAQATAKLLEAERIEVDILPATIPSGYWADAFVAIHADGNSNSSVSGFKTCGPSRDLSNKSDELMKLLYEVYPEFTGLSIDDNVTRNMRGYYVFNWWRYEHSLHPMTPGRYFGDRIFNQPPGSASYYSSTRISSSGYC